MRLTLSLFLVFLLASCPIVCGTAHASSGEQAGHSHASGDGGHSGLPAPANDDDCLCNGALRASDHGSHLNDGYQTLAFDQTLLVSILLPFQLTESCSSATLLARRIWPEDLVGCCAILRC